MRVDQDAHLGLAQHIDETRSYDHAVRVNGALRLRGAKRADRRDAAVAYADIAGIPGRARAVNDVAVADQEVEGRSGLGLERSQGEQNDGKTKKCGHDGRL